MNLFILHTQYNLILACGIKKIDFPNAKSHLILHAEFELTDEYKKILENIFDKVWYVQGKFCEITDSVTDIKLLYQKLNKISDVFKNNYENIFISQEEYFDTLVLSKLSKISKFRMYCIEEDIYFSWDNKYNCMESGSIQGNKYDEFNFKERTLQILKKIIFGSNTYYSPIYCYGMNPNYTDTYAMFPKLLRKEIVSTNVHETTVNQLTAGVKSLYSNLKYDLISSDQCIVFFFDLISRYNNIAEITKIVENLIETCEENEIKFLYKYHPREVDTFEKIEKSNCTIELPAVVPSEKILVDLFNSKTLIIGNISTSIQVAAKLQYEVISVLGINKTNNITAKRVFLQMGIKVPNDIEGLISFIIKWKDEEK